MAHEDKVPELEALCVPLDDYTYRFPNGDLQLDLQIPFANLRKFGEVLIKLSEAPPHETRR